MFMPVPIKPDLSVEFPDINLVQEVAAYLIELADAQSFIQSYHEAKKTIIACLEALIDFVTGPC